MFLEENWLSHLLEENARKVIALLDEDCLSLMSKSQAAGCPAVSPMPSDQFGDDIDGHERPVCLDPVFRVAVTQDQSRRPVDVVEGC